ncbi:MAG: hypothetical protein HGA90_05155 [Alphaproteobacteria bacterium]|nr:hypothetical protein [Alphaproteobacteria bacterium]
MGNTMCLFSKCSYVIFHIPRSSRASACTKDDILETLNRFYEDVPLFLEQNIIQIIQTSDMPTASGLYIEAKVSEGVSSVTTEALKLSRWLRSTPVHVLFPDGKSERLFASAVSECPAIAPCAP